MFVVLKLSTKDKFRVLAFTAPRPPDGTGSIRSLQLGCCSRFDAVYTGPHLDTHLHQPDSEPTGPNRSEPSSASAGNTTQKHTGVERESETSARCLWTFLCSSGVKLKPHSKETKGDFLLTANRHAAFLDLVVVNKQSEPVLYLEKEQETKQIQLK